MDMGRPRHLRSQGLTRSRRLTRSKGLAGMLSHLPWALAVAGLAVLATIFGVALTLNGGRPGTLAVTGAPTLPTWYPPPTEAVTPSTFFPPTPSATAGTVGSASSSGPTATTTKPVVRPDPRPAPTTTRPVTRAPSQPVPPTAITGTYRVLDSWDDGFIGEVLVANAADKPVAWEVRLRFGPQVTSVVTYWIEGAPQGSFRRDGADLVFTSGVKLPARSTVPLRFHLKRSWTGDYPIACTVNGTTCRRA